MHQVSIRLLQCFTDVCLRNQSVGVCALSAKLGGVSTMGLELLSSVWVPAPTLIMGITALGAGGLALALPETLNTRYYCILTRYYDMRLFDCDYGMMS